ncbi:baseplate assembly protein [Sphingomonas faeni]|uniref:baseplate assembly protein n=1 Tax=Sphingomonas faeni TaxID=185950 RepID=UPI0020C7D69B|nr:baseplate J/gp47 family protein [Sphingomonas faeni]MCP8893003.1 baseplate J/gp47 family protein [Sphingomonas faeni]
MAATSSPTTVDLSRFDPPTIVEQLDYETIFQRKIARVQALMPSFDATIDSDPAVKVLQIAAYDEMLLRQDFNERLQQRLVAYATGATLDHLGAAIGVARLVVTPASATTGAAAIYETDDSFRARIVLGPEGFSVAGPELAYVKHAKDASGLVLDASATSPAPGEVLVSVLSSEGDGFASAALLDQVRAIVSDRSIRPLGDLVSVESATQRPFALVAKLWTFTGPDPSLVLTTAGTKLDRYLADSRKLGRDITMSGLYAALTVEGVQRVELVSPTASIVCDLTQAARCTSIDVTHAGYDE